MRQPVKRPQKTSQSEVEAGVEDTIMLGYKEWNEEEVALSESRYILVHDSRKQPSFSYA